MRKHQEERRPGEMRRDAAKLGQDDARPMEQDPPGSAPGTLYWELVEAAPDAMVVVGVDHEIVLANRQAETLFGYSRTELVGRSLEMLLPERFHERHRRHRSAFASEPHARPMGRGLELHALRKSGEEFPVEISLSPLHTEGGLLVASAIRDVTDRRRLESELKAANAALDARLKEQTVKLEGSELRYQHVFHTAAVGIAQIALDDRLLDVNERFCHITGFERSELMHCRFQTVTHPDDRPEASRHVLRLESGEIDEYQLEKRFMRKDGAVVWVHHTRSLVRDSTGAPQYFVAIVEEITERKRSEAHQRLLAQAGQVLSSSLDIAETLQQATTLMVPGMADWCAVDLLTEDGSEARMVGIAHAEPEKAAWARELRERYPIDLNAAHGAGRAIRTGRSTLVPKVSETMLRDVARDEAHARILAKVGVRSVIITPLVARGSILGALTLVGSESDRTYDESDLALAEEFARRAALAVDNARLFQKAQQLNATLEARVQDRSRKIRQLASEITLAEARERGRIARLLHDDLQQQLHVLQFQLEELREAARSGAQDDVESVLVETAQAVKDASATARNLTSELSPIVLQSEDFPAALRWLAERFVDQYGLAVDVDASEDVRFSHDALRDVLFSLVRECLFNVVKHAGVERARVRLRRVEGHLELVVADEGRGFDPASIDRVRDDATGFGLQSASQRLGLFEGTLGIGSHPGCGTRITVRIPVAVLAGRSVGVS